jgi:hypothetical protein
MLHVVDGSNWSYEVYWNGADQNQVDLLPGDVAEH